MIIHIYANKSNIGDWLSALGIQSLLKYNNIKELFCDEPFLDETFAELEKLSSNDVIVIGGGGLFMDYFVPFWDRFLDIVGDTPFCIWGVGFCDLKQETSLAPFNLLKDIVKKSHLTVVRDNFSRDYLSGVILHPPIPCPSIAVIGIEKRNKFSLLHVDNYSSVGAAAYEKMDEFGKEFAVKTVRKYRKTNNRIHFGNEKELYDILNRYKEADFILSSALHGCILAVAMGKKIIAVSGDRKIDAFMTAAGLKDWVLNYDEVDKLPDFLQKLPGQQYTEKFTQNVRIENQLIAKEINKLLV